jgi:uridylate kinase
MTAPAYRRILLKLSGEALMGAGDHSIDPDVLERLAGDVRDLIAAGVQVALVIGGGNIFRGAGWPRAAWIGSPAIRSVCWPR